MSVEARETLVGSIYDGLKSIITVTQLEDVIGVVSKCIMMYDISEPVNACNDSESMDYFEAFLQTKALEGRTEKTVDRYRYELGRVIKGLGVPVRNVTVHHLRAYLGRMKERGLSDSTLENTRSIICSFFGWLHSEGFVSKDPSANLRTIKRLKVDRLPFSSTDLERIRTACGNARDRALVAFLISTGCRVSEVVQLNRNDIDCISHEVKVLGKGRKERTVYIDDISIMYLRRYLDTRSDTSEALFAGKGTDRITAHGIRAALKSIEAISGVKDVHPHRFRRTLATSLINHGMSIHEVAAILGHDKIDTTMTYVHTDERSVKNNFMALIS